MSKGRSPGYRPGDHWVISDLNGKAYRQSEMRKRWDGLWVHHTEWEPRQPQDFVRAKADRITPRGLVRPTDAAPAAPTITGIPQGTFNLHLDSEDSGIGGGASQTSAVAGIAIAGLAVAGTS